MRVLAARAPRGDSAGRKFMIAKDPVVECAGIFRDHEKGRRWTAMDGDGRRSTALDGDGRRW